MAEFLLVTGGIVTVAQLLGYIIKTSEAVDKFCDAVQDAPRRLIRVNHKLALLKEKVNQIHIHLQIVGNDEMVLPLDLRRLLVECISRVDEDFKDLVRLECGTNSQVLAGSLRKRLKYVLIDGNRLEKYSTKLEESEHMLDQAMDLLNFRNSLLNRFDVTKSLILMDRIRAALESTESNVANNVHSRTSLIHPQRKTPENTTLFQPLRKTLAIVQVDSWLRRIGFYGSLSTTACDGKNDKVRVVLGYKLPSWISCKAFDFAAEFSTLSAPQFGLQLLYGEIKVQNRVRRDSPIMEASANGDVKLIRQHLEDKVGHVSDRTMCTGSTPLMLAIEGNHLDAISCLLEYGADPNIGDDNQVLPVFIAVSKLNRNPRSKRMLPILPQNWCHWLEAFRLLVENGASVHEDYNNLSLAQLNITHGGSERNYAEPDVLDYFHILRDQCFSNFDSMSERGWCPLLTVIRRRTKYMEGLQFLQEIGVDFSRITPNGQRSVHWAAEMAYSVECLEFICSTNAIENINRKDKYGWTPLHYAVVSGRYGYRDAALDKIKCLLLHGADPDIKAPKHPIFFAGQLSADHYTPLELCCETNPELSQHFKQELGKIHKTESYIHKEDQFYDAIEIPQ